MALRFTSPFSPETFFRRGTSRIGEFVKSASERARIRKEEELSRQGQKPSLGQFRAEIGGFRLPLPNLLGESGAVATSEPARAQFEQNVNRLDQLESAFAPATAQAAAVPEEGETEVPAISPAITFRSPNLAFQNLIDQTNKLIETAKTGGALSPEVQNRINQINAFEAEKTKAIAEVRDATDKGDAPAQIEAMKKVEETEVQEKDIVQDLMKEMRAARLDLLQAGFPSERETGVRKKLQELRTGRQLLPLELRQEGISAPGITGRQVEDERVRAIQESNLLFELGLEQEARQFKTTSAEKQIGFIRDDVNLQLKIEDRIKQREDKVLEQARNLRKDSLTALKDIVTQFEGLAFNDLDADSQSEVLDIAKQFNIAPSLLASAMQNAKEQKIFDNAVKGRLLGIGAAGEQFTFEGLDITGEDLTFKPRRKLSAKEQDIVRVVNKGTELTNEAEMLYAEATGKEYEGFGSGVIAKLKGLGRFFGKAAGTSQAWQAYKDYLDSNRAPIAKGIKGEVGNLTENEQENALKSFPGLGTSPKNAAQKFVQIRRELQSNLETFGEFSSSLEVNEVDAFLDFMLE